MALASPDVKELKEEGRLACITHFLMEQSAIVPRGLLHLQINGCVAYNPYFRGLTKQQARDMKNFQLMRRPKNRCSYNVSKREDSNRMTDFFDTLDDLLLPKSFSVKTNYRDVCVIRSLQWLGMVFCHQLNTPHQGFFYFGNGMENKELMFML